MARHWVSSTARRRGLRAFGRSRSGATAVEFALIGLPLAGTLLGIIEVGLNFWTSQVLESAVQTAARQIYTGTFQTNNAGSNLTASQLQAKVKDVVCAQVIGLFDCKASVSVDVQNFPDTTPVTIKQPINAAGRYDTTSYSYVDVSAGSVGLVRASLLVPVYVGFLGNSTGLTSGGRVIMATATFRTEPYK